MLFLKFKSIKGITHTINANHIAFLRQYSDENYLILMAGTGEFIVVTKETGDLIIKKLPIEEIVSGELSQK